MHQADGALLASVCDSAARPAAARAGGGHVSRSSQHVDVGWGGPIDMSLLGPPPADAPPAACDQVRACPLPVHAALMVLLPLVLALPLLF